MANFDSAFDKMIRNEGGFKLTNIAGDRGGQTYAGIARNVHPGWPGWRFVDAIANATCDDDAAPECTCAAKDMTFGRCCKLTPNKCKWCGHDIHAHDKQYGCAEDGCDCETCGACPCDESC